MKPLTGRETGRRRLAMMGEILGIPYGAEALVVGFLDMMHATDAVLLLLISLWFSFETVETRTLAWPWPRFCRLSLVERETK
ncbi:uncharacterized protein LY89DRAFT_790466 [Mollisia scopiformis]|uniref:Uncharacterized protein n=1 Tax=Mollisia scopiformis TaxID=149040 RepID=A0A132B4L9_MOLSC|nr:uncharacterized protein LY89DRAFT_790466 [Mollisia scopiformis]KUJ06617.1 hypothetical protein LY89DRAFT_790466 [Mollisia scopiformis]